MATRSATPSLSVLLVDDEVLIRNSGQALLKALGHRPMVAANGQQALEFLADQRFDSVILDWTMPVMSGKEAFQEIRRRWPHIPIAISTGHFVNLETWLEDAAHSLPFVLQKPYSVEDLVSFLRSVPQPKE